MQEYATRKKLKEAIANEEAPLPRWMEWVMEAGLAVGLAYLMFSF